MVNQTSPIDNTVKSGIKLGFAIIGVILLLVIIFGLFYTVQAGEEAVLLTLGKPNQVASQPGLHLKFPIIQSVVKFDMRTQKYGADASKSTMESAASADLQVVKMQLAVNYHLATGTSPVIFSKLGANYEDTVIVPTVHEAAKAITARFTAADLIQKREEVRADMEMLLKEKLQPYNIIVEQVSIVNFDFSEQFNAAIENKVTAEQQKLKADNDLQRIKVEAEQVVATADGAKRATIANAEAQAEAIRLNAEAEALKVRLIQEQLKQSPQYIELQRVQAWNGAYPSFYMVGGSSPNMLISVPSPAPQ